MKSNYHWTKKPSITIIWQVVMARVADHIFIIDEDLCYGCAACIALCPINIIELKDRLVVVEEEKCTHCKLCIPSCPVFALSIKPEGVQVNV
jgi:NAD-dependent dihydropyrimidine dehydrogenase PreA subunit